MCGPALDEGAVKGLKLAISASKFLELRKIGRICRSRFWPSLVCREVSVQEICARFSQVHSGSAMQMGKAVFIQKEPEQVKPHGVLISGLAKHCLTENWPVRFIKL